MNENQDAAALARMLVDEQAAHHETRHSLHKVEAALSMAQRNAKSWQALATQRQQETEAALTRLAAICDLADSLML